MKTTIPAYLPCVDEELDHLLKQLMSKFGFMIRYSFKRLLEGHPKGDIEKYLSAETHLTIRHAKDAVEQVRQLIQSQHKLVEIHLALWQECLKKAEKKLKRFKEKNASPFKIKALESKVEKRKRNVLFWQQHHDHKTFLPVIFGGKQNFYNRSRGLLTREQWQEARNGRLVSRGDATKQGNPNLRVCCSEDQFYLEITIDQKKTNSNRYEKVVVPLYIARKVSKRTGAVNGRDYHGMMRDFLQTGKAYQVEILRRKGRYFVNITIEEEPAPILTHPAFGVFGVDVNPNGFGVAHVPPDGNSRKFDWIGNGELQDAPANKRLNIIGNLAKLSVLAAIGNGAKVVMEDLKFVNDKEVSAKFNRMSHQFCYRKCLQAIERNCLREGVECIKVHPAFTSVIGRLKYQPQYRINVHQSAALVIGRRGLGYEVEKVPKKLVKLCISKKKQKNFEHVTNWKQWSSIQESCMKKLKSKGGTLVSWLDYRKELLSNIT